MALTSARQLALTVSSALLIGWLCAASGRAQAAEPAEINFVGRLNTKIANAATEARGPHAAALRFCADVRASLLDIDVMMTTASAGTYQRLGSPHRETYRAAFLRRITAECANNAAPYMDAGVELAGVRSLRSGERIIGTRSSRSEKILMWQTRPNASGSLMVTDVLVDGRSIMLSLREQAGLALERNPGDVSALIQSLER